ncbi:hypothetical protein, partial [Mycobacterium marinum]|uniref:hypothetical protein n=4 Tax=Mycobacterium marinum TaxID=1781 RepID=UPI0021C35AE0
HEDLSVIGVCVVTTPIPEVLTYFPLATPFTTSLGVTPRAACLPLFAQVALVSAGGVGPRTISRIRRPQGRAARALQVQLGRAIAQ